MKRVSIVSAMIMTALIAIHCSPKANGSTKYKARLETKALCMNYTLTLIEGNGADITEASWTDESKNKTFTNAFGLANPCTFPASINEGDEFYFVIDSSGKRDCAVCMAYYPTPSKKLYIRVLDK